MYINTAATTYTFANAIESSIYLNCNRNAAIYKMSVASVSQVRQCHIYHQLSYKNPF